MKRLKLLPIAAFIIGISAAFISHTNEMETVWVYENSGIQVAEPECEDGEPLCAREFNKNPDGTLGAPTGNEAFGQEPSN